MDSYRGKNEIRTFSNATHKNKMDYKSKRKTRYYKTQRETGRTLTNCSNIFLNLPSSDENKNKNKQMGPNCT